MSAAVSRSPANQDRPLLHPSPLPSDQRAGGGGGRMRTLLDLLTVEKMDGLDHSTMMRSDGGGSAGSRWRILKERLGLRVVGCCGVATWRYCSSEQFPDHDQNDVAAVDLNLNLNLPQEGSPATTRQQSEGVHTSSGINLAAALAAEREFRATEVTDSGGEPGGGGATPLRVSLMRLLEETGDGGGGDLESEQNRERNDSIVAVAVAEAEEETVDVEVVGSDRVCCVCMGRRKGAAFIPCGHTYCRTCSRELWLNRGSCPLCNQRILEILDIF